LDAELDVLPEVVVVPDVVALVPDEVATAACGVVVG
jgi:hypothetical protein